MQISKVSNINFKGLWMQPHQYSIDNWTGRINCANLYYYPFKDESNEEIQQVVESYTKNPESNNSKSKENRDIKQFEITDVRVLPKLKITKAQYEAYLMIKSSGLSKLKQNISD